MDTAVLCSGCSVQWFVSVSGTYVMEHAGSVNSTVVFTTGRGDRHNSERTLCFQRWRNNRNTSIQLGGSGVCLPLHMLHTLRIYCKNLYQILQGVPIKPHD